MELIKNQIVAVKGYTNKGVFFEIDTYGNAIVLIPDTQGDYECINNSLNFKMAAIKPSLIDSNITIQQGETYNIEPYVNI